jgi:branched-chain amino acid aminotransferase
MVNQSIGDVLIDGVRTAPSEAGVSVFDIGFQRGYGCFEAMRAYGGRIFRLDGHLDRLAGSAARLRIGLPPRDDVAAWCSTAARDAGDSVVRAFVSGGIDPARPGTNGRVLVYAESVEPADVDFRVQSRVAPWHTDGVAAELTGAKILSYGYNLAATLAARRDGFRDALLLGRSGHVLEGPTFSIAWVEAGTVMTPALDLGILASITRGAVLDVAESEGIGVEQGTFGLERVLAADEVMALSTTREVCPVTSVDEQRFDSGPVTAQLAEGFKVLVGSELSG